MAFLDFLSDPTYDDDDFSSEKEVGQGEEEDYTGSSLAHIAAPNKEEGPGQKTVATASEVPVVETDEESLDEVPLETHRKKNNDRKKSADGGSGGDEGHPPAKKQVREAGPSETSTVPSQELVQSSNVTIPVGEAQELSFPVLPVPSNLNMSPPENEPENSPVAEATPSPFHPLWKNITDETLLDSQPLVAEWLSNFFSLADMRRSLATPESRIPESFMMALGQILRTGVTQLTQVEKMVREINNLRIAKHTFEAREGKMKRAWRKTLKEKEQLEKVAAEYDGKAAKMKEQLDKTLQTQSALSTEMDTMKVELAEQRRLSALVVREKTRGSS